MLKLRNRILQYGFNQTLRSTLLFSIKWIYKSSDFIILCICDHVPNLNVSIENIITGNLIDKWLRNGSLSEFEAIRMKKFIDKNCIGYYSEVENALAAWGFVQIEGEYQYGKSTYNLPKNVHMLKNLFVHPTFRGMSLGKGINEVRINGVPEGIIPCGFVIPENKYALRNLKMFGFEEYIRISNTTWFKKWKKQKITILKSNNITDILMQGFNQNTTL